MRKIKHNFKKLLCLTVALIVSVSGVSGTKLYADAASGDNWDGSSATAPSTSASGEIEIYTCAELAYVAQQINSGVTSYIGRDYILMNDLNLNDYSWTPIGTTSVIPEITAFFSDQTTAFSGTFDGNGHTIYNLSVSGSNNYRGLFGYTCNAEIKNLTICDATVSGTNCVGVLVGCSVDNLTIDNCDVINDTATSSVTASGSTAFASGGLVGYSALTTEYKTVSITNCDVYTKVTSTATYGRVGGLIGAVRARNYTYSGSVDNGDGATIKIDNCFTYGDVTSTYYSVGGIIGHYHSQSAYDVTFEINNSGASGNITTTGTTGYSVGGLCGFVETSGRYNNTTVKYSYATGNVSTSGTSGHDVGGLIGFLYTYDTDDAVTSPSTGNGHNTTLVDNCYATGNVSTSGNSGYYAGGLIGWLEVVAIADTNIATSYGSVTNCYATGAVSTTGTSARNAGGLIGYLHMGDVFTSYATGNVSTMGSLAYEIGGLVGLASRGVTIEKCYANGNVSTDKAIYVGGLVGHLLSNISYTGGRGISSIGECYATGYVTGGSYYNGGLVGFVNTGGEISNCYAIGGVQGAGTDNGALFGHATGTATYKITVDNCYATGTVTNSTGSNKGGLIGYANSYTTVTNCFFDTTMTGVSNAVGTSASSSIGATGLKTEDMIDVNTFSSWDISKNRGSGNVTWYIDDNITYPYLWYQYEGHTSDETNYNLRSVSYTKSGGTTSYLSDRTDFTTGTSSDGIDIQTTSGLTYYVTSAGAVETYYPYSHQKDPITTTSATTVSSTPATKWSIYSLGSISATDIVAFVNQPTAEKESDREDLNGDGVTDTYVGDIVKYTITLTNNADPDAPNVDDYIWHDVVVNDPLPDGIVLNSGTVAVTYPDGTTEILNDTQYTYDTTSNTLIVPIGNIPAGKTAIVTFEVTVLESAVGESIRNKGTATGKYMNVDHTVDYDDENDDPVLPAFKVTYYDNKGETTESSYVDSYYKDGVTYTVLGNDTTGFTRTGYKFTGWDTARDGTGTAYVKNGTFTMPANDVALYAQWVKTTDFAFLKVDANGYITPLAGAEFKLYICTDTTSGHTHTGIDDANPCWELIDTQTSADGTNGTTKGLVEFTGLIDGTYLLAETKAPSGYELPTGQWIIEISNGTITPNGTLGSNNIPALQTTSTAGIDLLVGNAETYELPAAGYGGIIGLMILGVILLASGVIWMIRRKYKKSA